MSAVSDKDFFYLTTHGDTCPGCKGYADSSSVQIYNPPPVLVRPSSVSSINVKNAMWMMVPCFGGYIRNYARVEQSIVMTFFKGGGAVFFGSTLPNCCANVGSGCDENIDQGGVGAIYYKVAKNFGVGVRVGDAYVKGKNQYLNEVASITNKNVQSGMNQFYGDPTLKIKQMW